MSAVGFGRRTLKADAGWGMTGWRTVGALCAVFWVCAASLFLSSCCDDEDGCSACGVDTHAPAAPRGLYSVTGDGRVTLSWLSNTESDLERYIVWWSDQYEGTYQKVADVDACADCYWMSYTDRLAENGRTYFYAVSAVDAHGNESDLSLEEVWDTPRPEGHGQVSNAVIQSGYPTAGFDFFLHQAVAADDPRADFYYYNDELAGAFLIAGSDYYGQQEITQVQDMGWTDDFGEIDFAPEEGWSPTGTAEMIAGHTYVLLTRDNHYAKIRVTGFDPGQLSFDWAYQAVAWNRQLNVLGGSAQVLGAGAGDQRVGSECRTTD